MADLYPYPFGALVSRAFQELESKDAIFDLPRSKFVLGNPDMDTTVMFHGRPVSSPLGPAAGPHTQMAQNLVLAWLAGARILELKTVQILDELEIPRPCIDMRTVGLNAEWSQELRLEQSVEEYVKGAMLVEMLAASGKLPLDPGFRETRYDLSVGYDLAGIRHERMQRVIRTMMDAREEIQRLRVEIPDEHRELRDLDFTSRICDSVTLSTFHGCPPNEIEGILEHLMDEFGCHCIVKLNPTLLGPEVLRELLNDKLGFSQFQVPDSAFEKDPTWEQAAAMVQRLSDKARSLGLSFGVKLTNTLIVKNNAGFLPAGEPEVYLSGQPLHVLSMHLVRRFRKELGQDLPISFSAGIDQRSFPDAVAQGLVPITVCTDLLKKGGYGRLSGFYRELQRRMTGVEAASIKEFIVREAGDSQDSDLDVDTVRGSAAVNTERYVTDLAQEPRYSASRNSRSPKKIDRHLRLFDCLTCDLCVPVCPNDANFVFTPVTAEIPSVTIRRSPEGAWSWIEGEKTLIEERHQIANFVDFCNECGNCDVFCPEDGGPWAEKPRFYGSRESFLDDMSRNGVLVESRTAVTGRFDGHEYRLLLEPDERIRFVGPGFSVSFSRSDPSGTLEAVGPDELDLGVLFLLDVLREGVLADDETNPVATLISRQEG